MIRRLIALFALTFIALGCGTAAVRHKKPADPALNTAITQLWSKDIGRVARDGDWILSRSYSAVGDAVVGLTRGEDFSHSVLYDAGRGTVIEAIRPVVREVSLEQFLARNRHVVVIRPDNQNAAQGRLALSRARSVLGAGYDYTGLIGLGTDSRFYCSELVAWASQVRDSPRIVTPAELWEMGELLYASGARDDVQLQNAARANAARSSN